MKVQTQTQTQKIDFQDVDLEEEFIEAQERYERIDRLEKQYAGLKLRVVEIKEMNKVYIVVEDTVGETVFTSFPTP